MSEGQPPQPANDFGVPPLPPPTLPPLKRPASADAFGIMNLVFGIGGPLMIVWGLVTQAIQASQLDVEIPQMSLPVAIFYYTTYLVLAGWLIVSGRKLMKMTLDARAVFKWYCIASLIIRPLCVVLTLSTIRAAFALGFEAEMQKQPQANDPDFERFMESFMGMFEVVMIGFMFIWSVVYEAVGLMVITRAKTAKAYEAYHARKGVTN